MHFVCTMHSNVCLSLCAENEFQTIFFDGVQLQSNPIRFGHSIEFLWVTTGAKKSLFGKSNQKENRAEKMSFSTMFSIEFEKKIKLIMSFIRQ